MAVMSDQVKTILPHLKEGAPYLFEHVRKGPFVGIYRGTKPTDPSDEQDEIFFEVDIYTEDGSGQERLANSFEYIAGTKRRPQYSKKFLRPSLLRTVTNPSTATQQDMLAAYNAARERVLPDSATLPTAAALALLQRSEHRSFLSKLFGRD